MPIITISTYSGRTQREKDRLAEAITEDVVKIFGVEKREVIILFLVGVLSFLIPFSYGQVNAHQQSQSSQTNFVIALVCSVSGIIGAIVGVISTVYLVQK